MIVRACVCTCAGCIEKERRIYTKKERKRERERKRTEGERERARSLAGSDSLARVCFCAAADARIEHE